MAAAGARGAVAAAVFGVLQRRALDKQQRLPPALRTAQRKFGNLLLERAGTRRAFENTLLLGFFSHNLKNSLRGPKSLQ
jgi:hypothetical protein